MVSGLVLPIWMAVGTALSIMHTSGSEETENNENVADNKNKRYNSIVVSTILIFSLSVPWIISTR